MRDTGFGTTARLKTVLQHIAALDKGFGIQSVSEWRHVAKM